MTIHNTTETMATIYSAMKGLSARQRAQANNIANINTPGFHAEKVSFEDALRKAVSTTGVDPSRRLGAINATDPQSIASTTATRLDGNNVSLDEETVESQDTALKYQLMTQAMTNQFRDLRTAIKGQ